VQPPVERAGHLVWAHTRWWEGQFRAQGLVRLPELERRLHRFFDPFLPRSNRSFYLLRRDTPMAAARATRLTAAYTWTRLARSLAGFAWATTVKHEVHGGLVRHLVAQRTPERAKALYRAARASVARFRG
jgi:hypothetical protein